MLKNVIKPVFHAVTSNHAAELLGLMEELYHHESIPWRTEVARLAVQELIAERGRGGAWLIKVGKETVGYFVVTLAFSAEFGGRFALLDELYLREAWTKKGIGGEALRFIEEQSRAMGAKALRLEAGYENKGAVRFYESNGFRREERYLMTKRLD